MLRCTIELLRKGSETDKHTIGVVEIANVGGIDEESVYRVILKKSKPYTVSRGNWRTGLLEVDRESNAEMLDAYYGWVDGFDRIRRGPYDLLFRALAACGLVERNPLPVRIDE